MFQNLISHSWLAVSKNERMSASGVQFTFVLVIPTMSAFDASCVLRPVQNPSEPEEIFLVDRAQHRRAVALWTILSSRAATARCQACPAYSLGLSTHHNSSAQFSPMNTASSPQDCTRGTTHDPNM